MKVSSAKLSDKDTLVITFPCQDDPTKNNCKFVVRVENISITSSNDENDLLLNDEDQDSGVMDFIADSYLNSYDGDNDDEEDGPSEDENATQSGDDVVDLVIEDSFLISI